MANQRIDVHTHLVPEFWAEELKQHGGDPSGWGQPAWNEQLLIEFMEKNRITVSMLSLTAPGIEGWQGKDRVDIARRVNDYGARFVERNPVRYGYLCALPLPDVDAALAELKRCYDELGVDGVCLHSNYDGIYLGDQRFDALWQALEERKAVVFLHPTTPAGVQVLPDQPSPLEDYPADTTKSAFDLVCSGHVQRFPSVRIILSHAGGFLPFVATRLSELRASLVPERSAEDLRADMRRFYFDTALVAPSGLPSLLGFADPETIVFGTDYPYASDQVSTTITRNFDDYEHLSVGAKVGIDKRAASLFPRFSSTQ